MSLLPVPGPAEDKPTVQASAHQGSLVVEASDEQALDSLEITSPDSDSRYHTGLPSAGTDRHFKRSFALSDVFPDSNQWKHAVRVTVTVRNTRGATAATTILIQPEQFTKGQ